MFRKSFFKPISFHAGFLSNFINLSFIQVSNALLQLFLFPVIFRIIGLTYFGYVIVANSFATLLGIFINYGTNQSGIKDIALSRDQREQKSQIFFSIIYSRFLLFCMVILVLAVLYYLRVHNIIYYLFAGAIIFSEVLNPIFFFIGVAEKRSFHAISIENI